MHTWGDTWCPMETSVELWTKLKRRTFENENSCLLLTARTAPIQQIQTIGPTDVECSPGVLLLFFFFFFWQGKCEGLSRKIFQTFVSLVNCVVCSRLIHLIKRKKKLSRNLTRESWIWIRIANHVNCHLLCKTSAKTRVGPSVFTTEVFIQPVMRAIPMKKLSVAHTHAGCL